MALLLEKLDLLGQGEAAPGGAPMLLAVGTIDEDPAQPRREFDEETLLALAATIRERGVRQPISVRPHPAVEGRWLLNFGARRLRASRIAGRAEIPAFVDLGADDYDQVIENEQREALKPLELAMFVQRRLAAGDSKAEIARRMGKGRAYVTYASALIDAPDWLLTAYREGRCRGLRELYELRRLAAEPGFEMEQLAANKGAITRRELRSRGRPFSAAGGADCEGVEVSGGKQRGQGGYSADVPRRRGPSLQGRLDGEWVDVRLDRVPAETDQVFVKVKGTGKWTSAPVGALASLRLVLD